MSWMRRPARARIKRNDDGKVSLWSRLKPWLLKAGLLPIIVSLGTLISMYLPISAPVEIEVEVNRVSMTAADSGSNALLPHTAVCSLVLRGFAEVRIPSASIWIADPERADPRTGSIPENAWKPWPTNEGLVLKPTLSRFKAQVNLRTLTKCGPDLSREFSVDGFYTGAGEVVLASPDKNYLSAEFHGEQRGSVVLPNEFEMEAEYCGDPNAPFPGSVPEIPLRIRPSEPNSFLTFVSPPSGMFAQLEFAPGKMQKAVISDFSVQRVDFTNLGPLDQSESTLTGPGTISYYGKRIDLAPGDVLTVDHLRQFSVLTLGAGAGEKSLSIHMKGRAGVLRSGTATEVLDRSPKWFDALTGDPRVEAIGKAIKAVREVF
jgi:hypothetical protein